jgi:hypothetical protein
VNCGDLVTVTEKATYHSMTGCISCAPVCEDGFYSEPEDFWTQKRAAA